MDKVVGIVTLFVGLTALSVVVSKRAATASVLNSFFNGIVSLQKGATAPLK